MSEEYDITGDLDLLGDWLDAKGYTEEAGLILRAMDFIHKQGEENEKLRAAQEQLGLSLIKINGRGYYVSEPVLHEVEKLRAATTPICVGRRIIGILAKEGAWTSENGASVIAADELFQRDPYEEIEKLRAKLHAATGELCDRAAAAALKEQ